MCDNLKMRRRHPPPGRPQANAVVERKIGLALSGIRAYLSTGCLPCCFWAFAGHAYAHNENWSSHGGTRVPPRQLVLGHECDYARFITGQLVMFKPAPTIWKPAKVDPRLAPGIFLDYYTADCGRFTGQYIICDLDDFCGKNLHHRIGAGHFKLRLHRTESVRHPQGHGQLEPLFPLRASISSPTFEQMVWN